MATFNPAKANLDSFTWEDLAQFKREGTFPEGDSEDMRVFYVGRDDVHGILMYLLGHTARSFKFNMFGYDDEHLDGLIRLMADGEVFVQGTLDRSQASGVHEKKILAAWDPAMRTDIVIGESATHQISHTKGGICDGLVAFEGSTNWSASGEGEGVGVKGTANEKGFKAQNNTLTVYTHPVQIALFTDELAEEHSVALAQQTARA